MAETPALLPTLVQHPGVGFIMVNSLDRGVLVLGKQGTINLSSGIIEGKDPLASYGPFIRQNLEIVRRLHAKKREGGFLRLLGEVQMRRGAKEEALQSFNEAISLLEEVGNPRQLWQAHASSASAYEQMGRGGEAKDQWGGAAELIRKVANGLSDRELRDGFLQAVPIQAILSKAAEA